MVKLKKEKTNTKEMVEKKQEPIQEINQKPKVKSKNTSEKIISCPKCSNYLFKTKMRKIMHPSGAILDICDKCGGMWIDSPEVDLLQNFKERKRRNKKI